MGYYSSVEGEIRISPSIPLRAMAGNDYLNRGTSVLMFEVTEEREERPDGTLLREHVTAIVPSTEDTVKAYSLVDDLREMVADVLKRGSACVGGWIIRTGEKQGDVERYSATTDGRLIVEKASLRWPDGTAVA